MARLLRLCPAGVTQHIIQRGNNRQDCFYTDEDRLAYTGWLKDYIDKFQIDLHAWVLMDNHVHLLATPGKENAIPEMIQSLGRQYVRYFNKAHDRSGTLWEGRYRACLVETSNYLIQCYRYIELNPVRAGMVNHPGKFKWSSYRHNAMGAPCELTSPHMEYTELAPTKISRLRRYQSFFDQPLEQKQLNNIRCNTNKGLILGGSAFKDRIRSVCQGQF